MSLQVLLAQSDPKLNLQLANYFTEREDRVWHAATPDEARTLLQQHNLDLIVVDIHQINNGWNHLVPYIQQQLPNAKLLFTISYPDPKQEARVKRDYGARTFLLPPFTRAGLEEALQALQKQQNSAAQGLPKTDLPKVRVPVRVKITLPYTILALLLALAAAYVVSQIILDTLEERFTNQLIEAGKLTNDWMVREEERLLETLRLLSHTQGLPAAVAAQDAERLREIALPLAVNYQEEAIEILDTQGASVLSLRHRANGNLEDYDATRGESVFSQWNFVQAVQQQQVDHGRDKFAGLARALWGDYLYVSGPIVDDQGNQTGVILVGKSLSTIVRQVRQDTLAHITIYNFNGQPLVSSLSLFDQAQLSLTPKDVSQVLAQQDEQTLIRPLQVASINYSEIVGPWEVREFSSPASAARTNNDVGIIGVSLAETFLARPGQITRLQIFGLTAIAFVLIIGLGVFLANRITVPLLRVVEASSKVAQGNLDIQVDTRGDDEVAVLAHSFNEMVAGLREGNLYRDLLGRTVSPEVREQLRQGFASGKVKFEGQETVATVLMSDIRGFTRLAESETPSTVMNWLNEYFEQLVPIITNNGGVISKFEGDAVLAFFGILPRPLSPQESAYQACHTALAIIQAVDELNARRQKRGAPPLETGIGINTGPVIAGALGSTGRLQYTIIGDTVNATARLENLTRQFGAGNSAVISQHTLFALRDYRHQFELEALGAHNIKGKVEQLLVYRLRAAKVAA